MGGLYWGIIFSTAVRTYLKGNILFLGFYLGSVYTMCRIVNPMMYDSMVYDYLKAICTKWAKYFGTDPGDLTYWAHRSREGLTRRKQKVSCKLLCFPKGAHPLQHISHSLASIVSPVGTEWTEGWMLWSWILFHASPCYIFPYGARKNI